METTTKKKEMRNNLDTLPELIARIPDRLLKWGVDLISGYLEIWNAEYQRLCDMQEQQWESDEDFAEWMRDRMEMLDRKDPYEELEKDYTLIRTHTLTRSHLLYHMLLQKASTGMEE